MGALLLLSLISFSSPSHATEPCSLDYAKWRASTANFLQILESQAGGVVLGTRAQISSSAVELYEKNCAYLEQSVPAEGCFDSLRGQDVSAQGFKEGCERTLKRILNLNQCEK